MQHLGSNKLTTFDTSEPILRADRLDFAYPQHPLFTGLSLCLPGGVTLVRGGDGRGKTTLLRLLAGDLLAQAGDIQINGVALADHPRLYRQQLFWLDSRSTEHDQITALQYFEQQRQFYAGFLAAGAPALDELINGLSLAEHMLKPLYMLSTGSKRKVWLAAAFAAGACVTLLDDPFAALDKPSISFVLDRLTRAATDPTRAWVVAHYEALMTVPVAQVIELGD